MDPQQCIRELADYEQIQNSRKLVSKVEEPVEELAGILALTGNSVRLKILFLLNKEQKLCVCDLADILQMKTPAVSQHLRKLRDSGLIKGQKEEQTIYYSLCPEQVELLGPLFQHISKHLKTALT